MITNIELKNFKSIKSKRFDMRRLNIVMGMNGQGKSSFIQSLLLLRQSYGFESGSLKLNGGENGLLNIGVTKDALYQFAGAGENLEYHITFNTKSNLDITTSYEAGADYFSISNIEEFQHQFSEGQIHKEPLFTNSFQYLNAQRVEPAEANKASYTSVSLNNDLGKYGEYTAHYIDQNGAQKLNFRNLIHPSSTDFDEITGMELTKTSLVDQINFWLGEISPGVSVKTQKVTNEIVLLDYEFSQPNLGFTNKFKPQNVGFGISYALHVVTAILKAKEGDLVVIENPESHIHPRGQAELGKLIAKAALNNIQIIIETHSDHIVNGVRVAVKENPELKDEVILHYFEKTIEEKEQYSKISDITIDNKGSLSIYPKNFLDEWSNQLFRLM
ncbi:AAA family ATPase [Sphingobacterium prati]|uniref:AAA family ATPase n=1 Tax=Sphingobacterium prati TaxID=2737006 RepID=UPI00155225B8|nr:DUF3696 domain-containing protein [Sphingobacterium prati]NPE46251.1 DUF3696 domain-containing protein [Sphingobacterium prati]